MSAMVIQNTDTLEHPETGGRRRHQPTPAQALQFSAGRVRDIAALRGLGFSYREIASHYGVTPQAISLLLARSRKQMKAIGGDPELADLSARACAALQRLGVHSRQEAATANVIERLGHARNCGRKTLDEISEWISGVSVRAVHQAA